MTREEAIKRAEELYPFNANERTWDTIQKRKAYLKGWEESQKAKRCECEHIDPVEVKLCRNCDGYVE